MNLTLLSLIVLRLRVTKSAPLDDDHIIKGIGAVQPQNMVSLPIAVEALIKPQSLQNVAPTSSTTAVAAATASNAEPTPSSGNCAGGINGQDCATRFGMSTTNMTN